jgi:uncharacterized cupin superfamily protein
MDRKHPNIINISEVEARIESRGEKFGFQGKRLGPHVGSKSIGSSYIEVPPGRQAFPNHFHSANEEAVFVIEGQGLARIGKDEVEIVTGDYLSFPVGPEHAHSIKNTSNTPLKLLCISTLNPVEIVGYPDSKKTGLFAMADSSKGLMSGASPWVRMLIKDQPSVDYYEDEI